MKDETKEDTAINVGGALTVLFLGTIVFAVGFVFAHFLIKFW